MIKLQYGVWALVAMLLAPASFVQAACTPAGTPGDDVVNCTGAITSFQYFYGGSDQVTLDGVSDITGGHVYWLDESPKGNPATDGNDHFIANNSRFRWVFGFGGDDVFEVSNSTFHDLYGDTNPNWVDQLGNDRITMRDSTSDGWILGGNDSDHIEIHDSTVAVVASGYSNVYGTIDYTPSDGDDEILLDNVVFSFGNYGNPNEPGSVEGGKGADLIHFINGGQGYNVFGGHGSDRILIEDGVQFQDCVYQNHIGNTSHCGIFGDEPYDGEPDMNTVPVTHGDDEIIVQNADVQDIFINGGHGSDLIEIHGPTLIDGTHIDGGDDRSVADGFTDQLVFRNWSGAVQGANLANFEIVALKDQADMSFADGVLAAGLDPNTGLVVDSTSSLRVPADLALDANLSLDGLADLGVDGNQPATTLSVSGDFVGGSGSLRMDVVLNDGTNQQADRLVIDGDSQGSAILNIHNANGMGGLTGQGPNDGILVVEVRGNSNGSFQLEHPLSVNGFKYGLYKGTNGNWYLRSTEVVPVPVFSLAGLAMLVLLLALAAWYCKYLFQHNGRIV